MKSGVPWQVEGVRQHARETAQEAARRAGMSIGEWLDAIILDSALHDGVDPRRPVRPQRPAVIGAACLGAVNTLRNDLAEIGLTLQEAMPRKAVEALEGEVRKLADRIDHIRNAGADAASLTGIERGLAEARDALRALTPAENLVGADHAVQKLSNKLDLLASSAQDPGILRQLGAAIIAMRGMVSHVASNDARRTSPTRCARSPQSRSGGAFRWIRSRWRSASRCSPMRSKRTISAARTRLMTSKAWSRD